MAIELTDPAIAKPLIKGLRRYRQKLTRKKLDTNKTIFDAVTMVLQSQAVLPDNPKFIWLSDLKPEDMADRTSLARQLREFWNKFYRITDPLYPINSMFGDRFWRVKVEDDTPKKTAALAETIKQEKVAIDTLLQRYTRAGDLITEAKIISSRFYRLNGNKPLIPNAEYSWARATNPYASSSTFPRTCQNYLFTFAARDIDQDSLTSMLSERYHYPQQHEVSVELINACEVIATNLFMIMPINSNIILVERPQISVNDRGLLHNESGPAIYFPKLKTGVYCTNGVKVTKDLVMKPAEELKADLILKTRNADVRREAVRKIGIERVLKDLGAKVIDKTEDGVYELVNLDLGDNRWRPYLKMKNPSIDAWHIEGVGPNTRTVAQALQYRNGVDTPPQILT